MTTDKMQELILQLRKMAESMQVVAQEVEDFWRQAGRLGDKTTSIEPFEAELDRCPNCDENAWDGRICHVCGAKDI